jgi:hypothetical protein
MRFDFYGQRDTTDTADRDNFWQGIDMTRDKPLVKPGLLSLGENTRLQDGKARQRAGTIIAADYQPPGGFANFLVGSGVYRNPNSIEILLVAEANQSYVWAFSDGKDPFKVPLDVTVTGDTGGTLVNFVQGFDKVVMMRVPIQGSQNLVWDGVNGDNFVPTVLSTNGLVLVPPSWFGEPIEDRIAFYFSTLISPNPGRDQWILSDVEDYTSYDDVYQLFRTNAAESDYITRIMAYFQGGILVFKNQSIHMVTELPTYPLTIQARVLSTELGSAGPWMPLMIGGDVIFLSEPNGFYRLSEIIQNQITALPLPVSEPIQAVINDINWPITHNWGSSASLGQYAFFGVARGTDATVLNTILVYNTQTRQWESAGDTWADPSFTFNRLHVTNYNGVHRLFAVDYTNSVIYLLYEGINDETISGNFAVPYKIETRGYIGDDAMQFKKFGRATVGISTYSPSVTITAITDGHNEEKNLTPVPLTKSPDKYYTFGRGDFVQGVDDQNDQKREDYSTEGIDVFAGEDFENLTVGEILFIPPTSTPTATGSQQESVERLLVRSFGRWCALRVENNQGVCDVVAAGVESRHAMNTGKVAV